MHPHGACVDKAAKSVKLPHPLSFVYPACAPTWVGAFKVFVDVAARNVRQDIQAKITAVQEEVRQLQQGKAADAILVASNTSVSPADLGLPIELGRFSKPRVCSVLDSVSVYPRTTKRVHMWVFSGRQTKSTRTPLTTLHSSAR